MNQRDIRGQARPSGGLWVAVCTLRYIAQAVDMKLNLQTTHHAQAMCGQLCERALQLPARIQAHHLVSPLARDKGGLALHPAGFLGPGQHPKALGNGAQQQIVGELKAGQGLANARLKHFVGRAIRGVFEHERADHAHAMRERMQRRFAREGFAARLAVRVAPHKTHQL